ncbi:MAG TPA: hypothetical protein DCS13_04985 [Candidatus Margulisbacteria bacterium]|nr:MAG: hypothetical protein A2X43_00190 [Candidatus Margulisbacteria bacterium GWD2_39_127]HAR62800.1 hypothetical protein [Candidatus Margulisiibacteriota bacterium]
MNLAVSTSVFKIKDVETIIEIATENDLMVEFSSDLPFVLQAEDLFLGFKSQKLLHNYFPAPKGSFVLNLASTNDEIRSKSIAHCINGLILAKKAGIPFFSAHAGFCIDPSSKELGSIFKNNMLIDKAEHWKLFVAAIREILNSADELSVDFLIENNVLIKANLIDGISSPLLCVDPLEISMLFTEINHSRFGLLLDTGHLKVSSATLGFDLNKAVDSIGAYAREIHHSDNNGLADTNNQLTEDYWFFNKIATFIDTYIYHVLEVRNISINQIYDQYSLIEKSIRGNI